MALENAQYIPELVETNPAGSDPVSQGDDHLRMTKLAVKNSFPGFVGTQASPKFVTLTEDQINDAALKSSNNTFGPIQTFGAEIHAEGGIRLNNAVAISSRNAADTSDIPLLSLNSGNLVRIGATDTSGINVTSNGSINLFVGSDRVARTATRLDGSFEVADTAGAFGPVAAVHKLQTFTQKQSFSGGLELSNDQKLTAVRNPAGSSADIARLSSTNVLVLGDSSNVASAFLRSAGTITTQVGGATVAKADTLNNGSLLVYDRNGVAKKAGFRNPTRRLISVSTSISQDNEGEIVEIQIAGITLTLPVLEANTTLRVINRSTGSATIAASGITIEWLAGNGIINGNRTLARGGVMEIWYVVANQVEIFGNGIS